MQDMDAGHVQHVMCHMVGRDSSAVRFDTVEITFILALGRDSSAVRFDTVEITFILALGRDSSAVRFDTVEITFILALFHWLKPLSNVLKWFSC